MTNQRHEKLKEILLDFQDIGATELDDVGRDVIKQIEQAFIDDGWKAPGKKKHLRRSAYSSFCGWGTESGAEFVSLQQDATCLSCINLAAKRASGLKVEE